MRAQHHLCPCCRFVGFREETGGTHASCDVCGWEDDDPQPARGAESAPAVEARGRLDPGDRRAEQRAPIAAAAPTGGVYAGPALPSSST